MPAMKVVLSSPPNKEKLMAELYFEDMDWGYISQEKDSLILEIFPQDGASPWRFDLDDVINILQLTKHRLVGENQD